MATRGGAVGPWFRRHPTAAATVVVVLFLAVAVSQAGFGDDRDTTGLLLALPVALAGVAYGQRGGTIAAAVGAVAIAAWGAVDGLSLTAAGWTSRVLPLALLGILLGRASDAQREAELVKVQLAVAETRRRDAAEINDLVIQRLVVAKWGIEAGRTEAALDELERVIEVTEELVCTLLADDPVTDRRQVRLRR